MKKNEVYNFKDLEKYYSTNTIKLSGNYKYKKVKTIFKHVVEKSHKTYNVSDNKLQCSRFKRRSLDDLIKCIKYYRPDLTVKDIINELEIIHTDGYYLNYCPDIKKHNFWKDWYKENTRGGLGIKNKTISRSGFPNMTGIKWKELMNK